MQVPQRPEEGAKSPGTELEVVVSCPSEIQGMELKSFGRGSSAPKPGHFASSVA